MKSLLVLPGILAFLICTAIPGQAETVKIDHKDHGHDKPLTATVHDHGVKSVAGAKFDAPNLIEVTKNNSVGVEVSKDLLGDPLHGDTRRWFEDDHGVSAYVKWTYKGCLICKD